MVRLKNAVTPSALAKVLRGALPNGPDMLQVCDAQADAVVDHLADLMLDLLRATPRPIVSVLQCAASEAWDMPKSAAKIFASTIVTSVTHCRIKERQSTSGKKLSPGVLRVVEYLRQLRGGQKPLSAVLKSHARMLMRRRSEEQEEVQIVPASSTGGSSACCAAASTVIFSSKSSSCKELKDLARLYDMPTLCKPSRASSSSGEVIQLLSSQEVSSGDEGAQSSLPTMDGFVEYFDNVLLKMVRDHRSGKREMSTMIPGSCGMAMAKFDGSDVLVQTECPNILLQMPVMKRPAAAKGSVKGKAAIIDVLAEEEEESDEGAPAALVKVPAAEEAPAAPAVDVPGVVVVLKSSKRRRVYSNTYHQVNKQCMKDGKDSDTSKKEAREAAAKAVDDAAEAGELD